MANHSLHLLRPPGSAPPVYRPGASTPATGTGMLPSVFRTTPPPVYRPLAPRSMQGKLNSVGTSGRPPLPAPPVFQPGVTRPGQVNDFGRSPSARSLLVMAPAVYRAASSPERVNTLQRMLSTTKSWASIAGGGSGSSGKSSGGAAPPPPPNKNSTPSGHYVPAAPVIFLIDKARQHFSDMKAGSGLPNNSRALIELVQSRARARTGRLRVSK